MFGTATRKSNGELAVNGFDALLDLDGGPALSDGKIDQYDAVYHDLRVWVDRNHDDYSQPDELVTLPRAGVTAIFTGYQESRRVDENGNGYRFRGTALMWKNGVEFPRRIFDVFLVTAN